MSTQLFLWSRTVNDQVAHWVHNGTSYASLTGSTLNRNGSERRLVDGTRDGSPINTVAQTVAGTTNGVELEYGTSAGYFSPSLWTSLPVSAQVTISGSITFNFWAWESAMAANVAINARLMKISGVDGSLTEIIKTTRTTELGNSDPPSSAQNWSETPGAGVTLDKGDRLGLFVVGDDAGTMASGYTFNLYDSGSAGTTGDSYITLTETLSFMTSDPAGSTVYLTTTGAGINPGSATELEAWTSRGSGVTTSVTNTVAGPTTGIQITDSAGGTAIEWYTKPLQAMTLAGPVYANIRGRESAAAANATAICELAVCDTDGSNPVVWAKNGVTAQATTSNLSATTETASRAWLAAPDVSVTNGQRLRIRVYIDDDYGSTSRTLATMASGQTATIWYAGTSGGASGDSYLTFSQTLAEYIAVERVPRSTPYPQLLAH